MTFRQKGADGPSTGSGHIFTGEKGRSTRAINEENRKKAQQKVQREAANDLVSTLVERHLDIRELVEKIRASDPELHEKYPEAVAINPEFQEAAKKKIKIAAKRVEKKAKRKAET